MTATAYRDADGMVLAAYGPSDLQVVCRTNGSHQVVCRTDGSHTASCSLKHVLPADCIQVFGLTGKCTGGNGLFVCMGPELSSNACQGPCE